MNLSLALQTIERAELLRLGKRLNRLISGATICTKENNRCRASGASAHSRLFLRVSRWTARRQNKGGRAALPSQAEHSAGYWPGGSDQHQ